MCLDGTEGGVRAALLLDSISGVIIKLQAFQSPNLLLVMGYNC